MEKKLLDSSHQYNELFNDVQRFIYTHPKWSGFDLTVAFSEGMIQQGGDDSSLGDSCLFPLYVPEITLYSMPPIQKIINNDRREEI